MHVNKQILIGNVGGDPITNTFDDGGSVTVFSVATSKKYKDSNGDKQSKTTWHRIVCWNKLSDIASKYVKKGDKIYVEGENTSRKWTDDSGIEREVRETKVFNLVLLGSKNENVKKQTSGVPPPVNELITGKNNKEEDDLPF